MRVTSAGAVCACIWTSLYLLDLVQELLDMQSSPADPSKAGEEAYKGAMVAEKGSVAVAVEEALPKPQEV